MMVRIKAVLPAPLRPSRVTVSPASAVRDTSMARMPSLSGRRWKAETFLTDLFRRGLTGADTEMICLDGGSGLQAAVAHVYPAIPVQRCWAHNMRNVLGKVRKADHGAVKADLQAVMNAANLRQARSAARRFAERWQTAYPKAVACLRDDLDELLTCFRYPTLEARKAVRTTNAIEHGASARSAAAPGPWASSRTEPQWTILFAVFMHENKMQGISALSS
jgi:hypothetical protein